MSRKTPYSSQVDDLKRAVLNRQAVLLLGSGVSAAVTDGEPTSTWIGLLRNGIARAAEVCSTLPSTWEALTNSELQQGISNGHLDSVLSVAEKVERALRTPSDGEYYRWLQESIGSLSVRSSELISALVALQIPILTTNYDTLVDDFANLPPVGTEDLFWMQGVVRDDRSGIVHLHGHWRAPEQVVFGIRSYERILSNVQSQEFLKSVFLSKTVIFVGCGQGVDDPNFAALRAYLANVTSRSGYRHYLLQRRADAEGVILGPDRLLPTAYGDEYSDLVPFLRELAPGPGTSIGAASSLGSRSASRIIDAIRQNSLILDQTDDSDDRPLEQLVLPPPLLPVSHDQYVMILKERPSERPKRIDSTSAAEVGGTLIVAGAEGTGLTTALQWITLRSGISTDEAVPLHFDYRRLTSKSRSLYRQARAQLEALGFDGRQSGDLPQCVVSIDNVAPGDAVRLRRLLEHVSQPWVQLSILGCREGDEAWLTGELAKYKLNPPVWYLGRLSDKDIMKLAALIVPEHAERYASEAVAVVVRESFQRTPWTVCLLLITLQRGQFIVAGTSETELLDSYITGMLGRGSPMDDSRYQLASRDREDTLAYLASQFLGENVVEMAESEVIRNLEDYFHEVTWREDPIEELKGFVLDRILKIQNGRIRFTHRSFLCLLAAKRMLGDDELRHRALGSPLQFASVIKHYAALKRSDRKLLEEIASLLDDGAPTPRLEARGVFAASSDAPALRAEITEIMLNGGDGEEYDSTSRESAQGAEPETNVAESDVVDGTVTDEDIEHYHHYYEVEETVEDQPFPPVLASDSLDGLWARLTLASQVLRDSVAVTDRDLKRIALGRALLTWGRFCQMLSEDETYLRFMNRIADQATQSVSLSERGEKLKRELIDLSPLLMGLGGIESYLSSKKLVALLDELMDDPGFVSDVKGATMAALLGTLIHDSGWSNGVVKTYQRHKDCTAVEQLLFVIMILSYYFGNETGKDIGELEGAIVRAIGRDGAQSVEVRQKLQKRRIAFSSNRLEEGRTIFELGSQ